MLESKGVTICLTSCSRWDLLEKTIKSLVQFWDGPKPEKLLIYEDQDLTVQHFSTLYGFVNEWLYFSGWFFEIYHGKKGQIGAIDFLYSKVQTPYIAHWEDDWTTTKSGFIQKSLSILEEKPNIMQVWIREPNDRNGHPASGQVLQTSDGIKYQMMKYGYRGQFHGFSFNPGLRRLSDYKAVFPNGFAAEIPWNPKNPLESEIRIGKKFFKHGFRAATTLDGYVRHIGNGRHING